VLRLRAEEFRAGWLVESLLSAGLIVLVLRTARPIWRSRPSRSLLVATLTVGSVALALPYSPLAPLLGLAPLPPAVLGMLVVIVVTYIAAVEGTKRIFYRLASLE
jgi:Mg2+-importing ATPase